MSSVKLEVKTSVEIERVKVGSQGRVRFATHNTENMISRRTSHILNYILELKVENNSHVIGKLFCEISFVIPLYSE